MTRTETAKRSINSSVTRRVSEWNEQISALRDLQASLDAQTKTLRDQTETALGELTRHWTPIRADMAALIAETASALTASADQAQSGHRAAVRSVTMIAREAGATITKLTTAEAALERQATRVRTIAAELRSIRIPNPWPPALIAGLTPTLAVIWLAWRAGLIFQ